MDTHQHITQVVSFQWKLRRLPLTMLENMAAHPEDAWLSYPDLYDTGVWVKDGKASPEVLAVFPPGQLPKNDQEARDAWTKASGGGLALTAFFDEAEKELSGGALRRGVLHVLAERKRNARTQ